MTFYMSKETRSRSSRLLFAHAVGADKAKEKKFQETAAKLLALKIPTGKASRKVIETGEPIFFRNSDSQAPLMASMAQTTGFEVRSMLTVALKTTITLGAIQCSTRKWPPAPTASSPRRIWRCSRRSPSIPRRHPPHGRSEVRAERGGHRALRLETHRPPASSPKPEKSKFDDKLIEVVGDAVIRREGIFPHNN